MAKAAEGDLPRGRERGRADEGLCCCLHENPLEAWGKLQKLTDGRVPQLKPRAGPVGGAGQPGRSSRVRDEDGGGEGNKRKRRRFFAAGAEECRGRKRLIKKKKNVKMKRKEREWAEPFRPKTIR
jgi:hypothetical protein